MTERVCESCGTLISAAEWADNDGVCDSCEYWYWNEVEYFEEEQATNNRTR